MDNSKSPERSGPTGTGEHKSLNVLKTTMGERTASGDTSLAKDSENIEEEAWPARRRQLIESKMAEHENTSEELAKLEVKVGKHEEFIAGYVEIAQEKPAAREQLEAIEAQRTEFLGRMKDIDSRESLREARNTISNLHKDSSPSSEELDVFNENIDAALREINEVNNEKIGIYEQYNQKQGEQIAALEKILAHPDPKDSEPSSPKKDTGNLKRSREEDTEEVITSTETTSIETTQSEDDGPSRKRVKLKADLDSLLLSGRQKVSESLIKSSQESATEALENFNEKKDDVGTWDQDIKDLIELRIPAAREKAETMGLKITEDLETIQSTLETIQSTLKEAKEQRNEGLKNTISRDEVKKAHQRIKDLLKEPVPETMAGFDEFDQVIREATKTKVDHCNQRMALYEQYSVVQLEQMKKLEEIENLYNKGIQEHDDNDSLQGEASDGERNWEAPSNPDEELQDITPWKK